MIITMSNTNGNILLAFLIQSDLSLECLIDLSAKIIEIIKITAFIILQTKISLIIELKCIFRRGFLVLK